ncbi:hypothetical protein TNCV_3410591 [Trichonephila clavipes]|nr:hypothetical protein TNCV_3410591 [Trichonephila clavipes]
MVSLVHQSLPPTDLGRVDDETASSGVRHYNSMELWTTFAIITELLAEVCLISVRLLPLPHPRSPDLPVCDNCLWRIFKSKMFHNNPHSLQDLEQNIYDEITAIPIVQLRLSAFRNLPTKAQMYQEINSGHFQYLL